MRLNNPQITTAFYLLFALPMGAQFENGEVLGTVRDASAAVVQGAKVWVRNAETNAERLTMSNADGAFSFPGLHRGLRNAGGTSGLSRG
jgi:hypothetical protein